MTEHLCECDDGGGVCGRPATKNRPDYDGRDFHVCDEHAEYCDGVDIWIETGYDPVLESQSECAAAMITGLWRNKLR